MIIKSNRIYLEDGCKSGYLVIEGSVIKQFLPEGSPVTADVDYGNNRIIPGIFDTHNHGGFGVKFDANCTEADAKRYLKGLASTGVTAVFPTTTILEGMRLVSRMADEEQDGARILGIHCEGPWGSRVGEKGINLGYPVVDMAHAQAIWDACNGKLKLIAIAPEVEGAFEAADFFVKKGVTVAEFHTSANYEQAIAGYDHGFSVATHLGNVMTGMHHRDVGVMGASLLRDDVDCELICDGLHVCLPMVQIVLKLKDHDKIMMISDSGSYLGAPQGTYRGSFGVSSDSDRAKIHVTKEGFVLSDTGRLSGSSKPVIFGMRNLVEKLGMPLGEVIRMSSYNPSRKYGFGQKGSLVAGKDADIVVIGDDFGVLYTYSEGCLVFDHEVDTDLFNKKFVDEFKID